MTEQGQRDPRLLQPTVAVYLEGSVLEPVPVKDMGFRCEGRL